MNPSSPRHYGDDDVRQLLERATQLQQAGEPEHSEEGVTLAELEEAAAEVGIRPRYIRRAAALLSNPAKARFAIFGRQSPHRLIQGELGDEDWNSLTVEIERIVGRGTVKVKSKSAGGFAGPCRTLQWRSTNGRTWICMTSGAGETRIWVGDYLADLLGAGLGGAAAGVFIALSIDVGFLGLGGALLLGALLGLGTALLVKLGFKPMVAGIERGEALERLVERVASYAQPEYERLGE